MNTAFVMSRHGSFQEIIEKMGGDKSFMVELFVIRKYAERSENVFVFSHDKKSFEGLLPENCRHVKFYHPLLYSLFAWFFVVFYALRFRIKIIYVESITGMIPVVLVNRLTGAKVVLDYLYLWHLTTEGRLKRPLLRIFESFLIRSADYFIAANNEIRGLVPDKEKILETGANSLLLDCFRKAKPDRRIARLGGKKGKKIIFVGRLIRVKDPVTLVKSHRIARKKFPDLHLVICGDGELKEECKRLADENVHFLGFAKNVPSLLKASDMFVIPSLFDASPRALVEAMGTGLPCIGTRVGGIPDYLDESTGILTEPGNAEMLAEKIEYVLENPKAAQRLGRNAKKKVYEEYDLEKNTEKLLDFLTKKA
jgi:glycosyltransferase involved in cell wall biosynthesis